MSSKNDDDKPKFHPLTKVVAPILATALMSVLLTAGGIIAKHEGDIRTANRKLERSNVDKYRRTLTHFRDHYSEAKDCVTRNKRFIRDLSDGNELIHIAQGNVDECEEDKAEWRERIENYVEENKHMGYD